MPIDVLETLALAPLEIVVYRILVPFEGANLAVDQFRQTRLNVIAQPANDEAGEVGGGIGHRLLAN